MIQALIRGVATVLAGLLAGLMTAYAFGAVGVHFAGHRVASFGSLALTIPIIGVGVTPVDAGVFGAASLAAFAVWSELVPQGS
jgi:hypothetical protein